MENSYSNNKFLIVSWFVQKATLLLLNSIFNGSIQAVYVKSYDLEVKVNSNNVFPILNFLQKHTIYQFESLSDIVCQDNPGKELRFSVTYSLLSVRYNARLRLVTKFKSIVALLSVYSLFFGSGWMEREILDMFGVFFFLNKDLRRILTDYGFNGYALRKDFPLTGYLEIYYDDNQKLVSYKLVELSQEYRSFNFKLT